MAEALAGTGGTRCHPQASHRSRTHQGLLRTGSKANSLVKEDRSSRKGTREYVPSRIGNHRIRHSYQAKSPKSHYSKDFGARGLLPAKPSPDLTAGPASEGHSDCGRLTSLTGVPDLRIPRPIAKSIPRFLIRDKGGIFPVSFTEGAHWPSSLFAPLRGRGRNL